MPPELVGPGEHHRSALVWRWPEPMEVTSSAAVGGGSRTAGWLVNAGVADDFAVTDLDAHARALRGELGLAGPGVVLLTAAAVDRVRTTCCDGVEAWATVGVTKPTWAADETDGYSRWEPGTINIVVAFPVALSDAAVVNAVITATEAKCQALQEAGVPGTGTATDAVAVVHPGGEPGEAFAGPRSVWGGRAARAVHTAVREGLAR